MLTIFIYVTRFSYVWRDVMPSYVWRDVMHSNHLQVAVPPRPTRRDSRIHHVCHDSFTLFVCVTWLMHILHMCDATHSHNSYVWRDSSTALTHCYWSSTSVPWRIHTIHTFGVTHSYDSYKRRDSFILSIRVFACVTQPIDIWHVSSEFSICVTCHLHTCDSIYSYVWRA